MRIPLIFALFLPLLTVVSSLQWRADIEGIIHRWLHGSSPSIHVSPRHNIHPSIAVPSPPSWVIGAGTINHTIQFDYSHQMMHKPEVDLVASYLRPGDIYLEYGSGGSTRNFPRLVKSAYSIEHNCEWSKYLQKELDQAEADYSNLKLICVPVLPGHKDWGTISRFEHASYRQFKEYVDAVDNLPDVTFDRVFIDGRARMACALRVLHHLKPDSLVFIHDFYSRTELYGGVMDYYNEVARVLAVRNTEPALGPIDEPQGLVVLRPKPEAIGKRLTDDQINIKYDSINWRQPFAPPINTFSGMFNYYVLSSFDISKWKRARNPDHLLRIVKSDLVKIMIVYTVLAVCFSRLREVLLKRKKRRRSFRALPLVSTGSGLISHASNNSLRRSTAVVSSLEGSAKNTASVTSEGSNNEPRFFETEAIKMAKARRQSRQTADLT